MKKKLLIAVVALVLIVAIGAGILVSRLDSIVQSQKPAIEKVASQTLGTPVSLGAIEVSVLPKTTLGIATVLLGKTKNSDGITVNNVALKVDPWKLLSGELLIEELLVREPRITARKTAAGVVIDGLPVADKSAKNAPKAPKKAGDSSAPKEGMPTSPIKISLKTLSVDDASLKLIGFTPEPVSVSDVNLTSGISIEGEIISLPTTKFSALLPGEFPFQAKITDLSFNSKSQLLSLPNISLNPGDSSFALDGTLDAGKQTGDVSTKKGAVDLASLVPLVAQFAPVVKDMGLGGTIDISGDTSLGEGGAISTTHKVVLNALELATAGHAVSELSGAGSLKANLKTQKYSSDSLTLQLNGKPIETSVALTNSPSKASAELPEIKAFGGIIGLEADVKHSKAQPFTSELSVKNLQIAEALGAIHMDLPVSGQVDNFTSSASGKLGSEDLVSSVSADGQVKLSDAVLKGINLPGIILKEIKDIPGMSGALTAYLPADIVTALSKPDTGLSSLRSNYSLKNGTLNINDLDMVGDFFQITGGGTAGVDMSVDMTMDFFFTPGVSSSLAESIKELRYVIDDSGRIKIPLRLQGTAPSLIAYPKLDKLLNEAAKGALKEKAGEAIDKFLSKQLQGKVGGANASGEVSGGGRKVIEGLGKAFGF